MGVDACEGGAALGEPDEGSESGELGVALLGPETEERSIGLGEEVRVGDRWGRGIAAQFIMSRSVDSETNPSTWSTFGGGAAFSPTLNK